MIRPSDPLSKRIAELCAYANGAELCPYKEVVGGCPPWFDDFGLTKGKVEIVSPQTYRITFRFGRKTFAELRDPIDWEWLCCPFRMKSESAF